MSTLDLVTVEPLSRPSDEELLALLADKSAALVDALKVRPPQDSCWSWHDDGHHVGWVARRQAHEALIHRVDAELTAARQVTGVDPTLAADGVDEILTVMVDGVPPWGRFDGDGATLGVHLTDAPGHWNLEFGRFTGTSPASGRTYDLDAACLCADTTTPDVTLDGRAWDLDRWLWGRGSQQTIAISGDSSLVARLRSVIAESTV